MPIYEYRCKECKRITSILVRSTSKKFDATCEHCGGKNLERLISRFNVVRGSSQTLDQQYDDFQRQVDSGESIGGSAPVETDG